jgi:predicted mannosyl-3-phosphoglycerate phosphatase (HAD superfamily)
MVFKVATLKNGSEVYLRQGIAMVDVITSSTNGLEFEQIHIAGAAMRALLDEIQKDCVVTSNQETWEQVYELYTKLNV